MKTLHFGIEMEMTGITREKAANLMAGFFGTGWGTHQGGVLRHLDRHRRPGPDLEGHERFQHPCPEKSGRPD